MKLNPEQLERLALHSAFGFHLIAKMDGDALRRRPEIEID